MAILYLEKIFNKTFIIVADSKLKYLNILYDEYENILGKVFKATVLKKVGSGEFVFVKLENGITAMLNESINEGSKITVIVKREKIGNKVPIVTIYKGEPPQEKSIINNIIDEYNVDKVISNFKIDTNVELKINKEEKTAIPINIMEEIDNLLMPKVEINGGGNIIIYEQPAFTFIDVNTENVINKESFVIEVSKEIKKQLELRLIGGNVFIDFMNKIKNKNIILDILKTTKNSQVLGFSKMGILELRIKKTEESIKQKMCGADSIYRIKPEFIALKIVRDIKNQKVRANYIVEAEESIINQLKAIKDEVVLSQVEYIINNEIDGNSYLLR